MRWKGEQDLSKWEREKGRKLARMWRSRYWSLKDLWTVPQNDNADFWLFDKKNTKKNTTPVCLWLFKRGLSPIKSERMGESGTRIPVMSCGNTDLRPHWVNCHPKKMGFYVSFSFTYLPVTKESHMKDERVNEFGEREREREEVPHT